MSLVVAFSGVLKALCVFLKRDVRSVVISESDVWSRDDGFGEE